MGNSFAAGAISRQDGSSDDGIHLLWSAPRHAGYSITGFDIQRRPSREQSERRCHTLTADELTALHRDYYLEVDIAHISLRKSECPEFPPVPNEPAPGASFAPTMTCADFREAVPGDGPNPRIEQMCKFLATVNQQSEAITEVRALPVGNGLVCNQRLEIELPIGSTWVELLVVCPRSSVVLEAFRPNGASAGVKMLSEPAGISQSVRFSIPNLAKVVIYVQSFVNPPVADPNASAFRPSAGTEVFLQRICVGGRLDTLSESSRAVGNTISHAVIEPSGCWQYDINLLHDYPGVQIISGTTQELAIALRSGKSVDAHVLTGGSPLIYTFEKASSDRVRLYTKSLLTDLTICLRIPQTPDEEEKDWSSVPYIATGIQLPLRSVNPATPTPADEDTLAALRLPAGAPFNASAFRDVSDRLNQAANHPALVSPIWITTNFKERTQDSLMEMRSWLYAQALTVDTAWRRMLGFGYRDNSGLISGASYDYRISGRFYRRDVEETLYGFHTVPRNTTLPSSFHMGPLLLDTLFPSKVESFPPIPDNAMNITGRKGIRLQPMSFGSLRLTFPGPVKSIVLEFEPGAPHDLTYFAVTTDYIPGLSGASYTGPVPPLPRVQIDFAQPVDTVRFDGKAFLYGIRYVDSPAGSSPSDLVRSSVIIHGVVYQNTTAPDPPSFLGTVNLQTPIVHEDPKIGSKNPPQPLGFRLFWVPPTPDGGPGVPWPKDLGAFPPFDAVGFNIERRRVDVPSAYKEIGGEAQPTFFVGARVGPTDPPQLSFGIDILDAYSDDVVPAQPVPIFMSQQDVLTGLAQPGPPPGSTHQYRIFAVDAIGRRSTTPTEGSIVRLEKHVPPPQPVDPPSAPPPPLDSAGPVGVRARVLQSSDSKLGASDQKLLGGNQNAILLEWGWTDQERTRDPWAKTFRIYFQSQPPDVIHGQLTGSASKSGGEWVMNATMDQPVAANAMAGRIIAAGADAFEVSSHDPGTAIQIHFKYSALHPDSQPQAGDFEFHPTLDGTEMRPGAWPERTEVVNVTVATDYSYVFRDRLTIDATHSKARVWVGVSSADDQSYVDDEITSGAHSNLPGNESSVAAVAVDAHYIGQPKFVVPAPLVDVPELVTAEPNAGSVSFDLDLPALLPAVTIPAGHLVTLEYLSMDRLLGMMSAPKDDQIHATFPDDNNDYSYTLANPGDHKTLLAEIRTGEPARVEGKFLMDFLLRYTQHLEKFWNRSLPEPQAFAKIRSSLPEKAERYLYRSRLVDPAGHVSSGAAILPLIVRVPSLRSPSPPVFDLESGDGDSITVKLRMRDAFDLKWALLFVVSSPAGTTPDQLATEKVQLLRLPSRRDLYPNNGIRLRLGDGSLVSPVSIAVSTGSVEIPDRLVEVAVTPGFEKQSSVWTIAMTRDGIPSRIAGPRSAFTGPAPTTPPTLTVQATGNSDHATWTAPPSGVEVAIERSTDSGTTWTQVTPWLPEATNPRALDVPGIGGSRQYRIVARASRNRRANGPPVTPS
jgi:hypothetical protein